MAQRTRDVKYAIQDAVLGSRRSFMSSVRDQRKLLFDYGLPVEPSMSTDVSPVADAVHLEDPARRHAERHLDRSVDRIEIPDVHVTASERIQAIIACKLKMSLSAVPLLKSIKELSSGRSTLQNELVGDLISEFGSTPDGSEDMSLSALATAMTISSGKPLGPELTSLVAKYVTAAMPVGLNMRAVRDYLASDWGLGAMRQTSVLLHAMTAMTATASKRYETLKAAHEALDQAALDYAENCSLGLEKRQLGTGSASSTVPASSDPAVYDRMSREARTLAHKQRAALSDYLGLETGAETSRSSELVRQHHDDQAKLNAWAVELDTAFADGIKPHFRASHIRRFNFWWNQARVDVMRLYHDVASGLSPTAEKLQEIANRSDQNTLRLVNALCLESRRCQSNSLMGVEMQRLACSMGMSLEDPPAARFSFRCMKPQTTWNASGSMHYTESARFTSHSSSSYRQYLENGVAASEYGRKPTCCLVKRGADWTPDDDLTSHILGTVQTAFTSGLSFRA